MEWAGHKPAFSATLSRILTLYTYSEAASKPHFLLTARISAAICYADKLYITALKTIKKLFFPVQLISHFQKENHFQQYFYKDQSTTCPDAKSLLGALHTLRRALRTGLIPAVVSVFAKRCSSEVTDLCYLTALIAVTPNSLRSNKINKCAHFLSLCAVFSLLREIVFQHGVTEAYVTDGFAHGACAYFTYCFCVKSFAEQALTMDFLCTKGLLCSQITCVQPQAWPMASINSLTSFRVSTQCWQLCFH